MWVVYLKELLELARDRKTFIFTVLIPILVMPAIAGLFGYASSVIVRRAQQVELSYAIFGKENAPDLARAFARIADFKEVALDRIENIRPAIGDERIKFALVIPADFSASMTQKKQSSIAMHFNSTVMAGIVEQRVTAVIDGENQRLRDTVLTALNLSKEQLRFAQNPIRLEPHSTAGKREQLGALAGGILPYILLMVCLSAAMYPAIDLGAGEKERGTLETLLLAPVPRSAIVFAKFGVLLTVGLTSALLMVFSIGFLLFIFGGVIDAGLAQVLRTIGVADLAMLALMLAPVAAIFASLLLSISIYAKNFKEAQGFITPMMLIVVLPIALAMLPGVELNWVWAMVPLTNVSLAMKELIKGTMDYRMFAMILFSTTVIAGALLAWCRWWFDQEQVLFR